MVRGFFGDVRDVTTQMERIVINLLALTRQDAGHESVQPGSFDVALLVSEAWDRMRHEADAKDLRFHYQGPETLILDRGHDQWLAIVTNLLGNSLAYSPADSDITCAIARQGRTLSFSLANRSDDLTRDDLALIFDRFWRKDAARTDGSDHRSFPSGHAVAAFTSASLITQNVNQNIEQPLARASVKAGGFGLAAATAWARVEGEKHYPVDVLVSAAVGNFFARFFYIAFVDSDDSAPPPIALEANQDGLALRLSTSF